jgi:hypothetical protein
MVRNQTNPGPGIVEWSLPETDIGEVWAVVPLREGELDPDDARTTWCPVCAGSTTMRAARACDGRRFDFCDGCGLLWHVDRRLGRAVAHRVAVYHGTAHKRADATDVRPGTAQSREGTHDPVRSAREAHPVAS